MTLIGKVALMAAAATLAACGTSQMDRMDPSAPSVTYSFEDDSQAEMAGLHADRFCETNYNRGAVFLEDNEDLGIYEVAFACEWT